jgi:hypothetical protein
VCWRNGFVVPTRSRPISCLMSSRKPVPSPLTRPRVNQLIEAGAWADATLAMVELELPYWNLRRLVHEDGEWLCSLSKQPNLPVRHC